MVEELKPSQIASGNIKCYNHFRKVCPIYKMLSKYLVQDSVFKKLIRIQVKGFHLKFYSIFIHNSQISRKCKSIERRK